MTPMPVFTPWQTHHSHLVADADAEHFPELHVHHWAFFILESLLSPVNFLLLHVK